MFGRKDESFTQEDEACEGCGRSVISRFGGEPSYECESCATDADKEWNKTTGNVLVME